MKIFVTGATGVIGRRLVPLLLGAGHDVTALAHSPDGRVELEARGAATTNVSLFDPDGVRRAVEGHDAVVNLATHIPHTTGRMLLPWAWRENDRLRRVASNLLVDTSIAAGVTRFVQESFAGAYPDRGSAWIDETVPLEPTRHTSTVLDAEAAAARFSRSGGVGIVLRFAAFYGSDAVQTEALVDWVRRGWAPLPGRPDAYISSVSHDDAAAAVSAAMELPSGTYNVTDDEPLTHRAFVDSVADALSVPHPKLPPPWVTPLLGSLGEMMARSLRLSNRRLRSDSAWAPRYTSVRQGWPALGAAPVVGEPHPAQ